MYEVHIKIRFDEPCLGNEWRDDPEPNTMVHGPDGCVIFREMWWKSMLWKAADAFAKHRDEIRKVSCDPRVDGTLTLYKRYYMMTLPGPAGSTRVKRIKLHEAFDRGATIGVRMFVPDGIPLDDFKEILSIAGVREGISPYGWKKGGWGKFRVMEVLKAHGRKSGNNDPGESVMDQGANTSGAGDCKENDNV